MTYLTRLFLNPRNRNVQRDLADCHDLHRTVLSGFPQAPSSASARDFFCVLHRVDINQSPGSVVSLLVQSRERPVWSDLPNGYLAARPDNLATKPVDDQYGAIRNGDILMFRLRANPTKRVSERNREQAEEWRGKRIELRREEDQLRWLEHKGEVGGFRLVESRVRPDVPQTLAIPSGPQRGRRDGERLSFGAVLFQGQLRVTDADLFRQTLLEGLGSGKAYGFGLLSVARAAGSA